MSRDPSLVVYDDLGGGVRPDDRVCRRPRGAQPFERPTPIDAINAALVDEIFYQPIKSMKTVISAKDIEDLLRSGRTCAIIAAPTPSSRPRPAISAGTGECRREACSYSQAVALLRAFQAPVTSKSSKAELEGVL